MATIQEIAQVDIDQAYEYFYSQRKRKACAHECLNIIFLESLLGLPLRNAISLDQSDVRYLLASEAKVLNAQKKFNVDFWLEQIQKRLNKRNYLEALNILVEVGLELWQQKHFATIQLLLGDLKIPQEEKTELSDVRTQGYIYFLTHYILIAIHYGKLDHHSKNVSPKVRAHIEKVLPTLAHFWFWALKKKPTSYLEIIFEIDWIFLLLIKGQHPFNFPMTKSQFQEMSQDTLKWIQQEYSIHRSKKSKKLPMRKRFHTTHQSYHQAILALFVLQESSDK